MVGSNSYAVPVWNKVFQQIMSPKDAGPVATSPRTSESEQISKFTRKRSLARSDRREVVSHATRACIPSNRIKIDEDEANPRCRPFHSPAAIRGLASAVSHSRTSGIHVHYSATYDIAFMSQVAPGKSAEVLATPGHRPTYGTQEGLASNGAAVAALGLCQRPCRPSSVPGRPELGIRGHRELQRRDLWQREWVQWSQVRAG